MPEVPSPDAPVGYQEVDGVAVLTLDEPKSMNALSAPLKAALAAAIEPAMASEPVRCLLLTGRSLQAREALACGLVSRVVPQEELHEAALQAARAIASGPVALRLTRELVNHGQECSLEAFLAQEALAQAAAFGTRDFDEGVTAFLERRAPAFTGH